MQATVVKQRYRAYFLLGYLFLFFCANYMLFRQFLPPSGGEGLWFYSGLASLLLGNLVVTPFFSKPSDTLSYSFIALIALFVSSNWLDWSSFEKAAYLLAMLYPLLAMLLSLLVIFLKDSEKETPKKISSSAYVFATLLGKHEMIFSVVILFGLLVFHRHNTLEVIFIGFVWSLTIIRPEVWLTRLIHQLRAIWTKSVLPNSVGEITAYQMPNVIIMRSLKDKLAEFGSQVFFRDPYGEAKVGLALDCVGRDSSVLQRIIYGQEIACTVDLSAIEHLGDKEVVSLPKKIDETDDHADSIDSSRIVGLVSSETNLNELLIDVIQEKDIEEGTLVETLIKGAKVVYQVVDGITKEDIVYQKNTVGYAKAKARKIGNWDSESKKFNPVKWIPTLNTPVYVSEPAQETIGYEVVGCFPGSSYSVRIEDIDSLVTHNTAILGILGVGKSMLAIELVERMLKEGIKVICIDLTDQYAEELDCYYDNEMEAQLLDELQAVGPRGKINYQRNVEDGGSSKLFYTKLREQINAFLEDEGKLLKVLNPAVFEVWRQDSKFFSQPPSMASLTPAEITRVISEVSLELVQQQGTTNRARLCLVYEEAHSLVPEWNSVVAEGDKSASNGIARAILQGRKYGMGCLLITQRTANVAKTILNQCNSIFAMRTYDETGLGFLANYIGGNYSNLLPGLPERTAIFYGKASSCENPVIIRLNDRENFVRLARHE